MVKMDRRAAWILLLLLVFGLTGCGGNQKIQDPLNWQVQDFTYTNQDGQTVGLSDLHGKVWLADFIFTNCTTVCSPMTAYMAEIQEELKKEGLVVTIVSFTVDPERDQPNVLKEFAKKFGADFSNWHFLTGYSPEEIGEFSQTSFKSPIQKEPDSDQFMHVTSFFLVDQTGTIVKRYSGVDRTSFDEMLKDIQILQDN